MPDRTVIGPHRETVLTACAWRWYLACALPLTVAYLWLPVQSAKVFVWPIVGWSSVVAIIIGVRVNRPSAPVAWYLLAAGVGTF